MSGGGEDDLIARYFAPLAGPGSLGLLDDAALLTPAAGRDMVVTADALVAGVHFFPHDPPASIGRKALGVNLSDLAAKGADPDGFILTIALPTGWTEPWLEEFCLGLGGMAAEHGCPLLGGDTVATPGPLTTSITAFGSLPSGRMVRRTTARPGDAICVTGTIGDAVLGLALLRPERPGWRRALSAVEIDWLVDRYRHPRPRTALATALREHASAGMDVSDGLAGDLAKMLWASGASGTLHLDCLPLSPAARAALKQDPSLLESIAGGGDDYEILVTLSPDRVDALAREAGRSGLALTAVGTVEEGQGGLSVLLDGAPVRLSSGSYQHF